MSLSVLRFVFGFIAVLAFCDAAHAAAPKDPRDKYVPATLANVTNYLVQSGLAPLENDGQTLEFVLITECEIYKLIVDSPFKQQELKLSLMERLQKVDATNIKPLYIKVESFFVVKGYNFDTQSITILPYSQIKKANIFDVVSQDENLCVNLRASNLKLLPSVYVAKLNYPISLFRIPMKQDIAESLLANMEQYRNTKDAKIVYANLYLQIDPVPASIQRTNMTNRGMLMGQVDAIDLYLDQDRKVLFKHFNYADNY